MATILLILQGARIATCDILDYHIALHFGDQKTYHRAAWFIPAWRLSEIRAQLGRGRKGALLGRVGNVSRNLNLGLGRSPQCPPLPGRASRPHSGHAVAAASGTKRGSTGQRS